MYYSKCDLGYVLRVEMGEEIQEALRQFAQKVNLKGAFYQGIGALSQVELAFFRIDTKDYDRRFFDGEYEMVTFMGNLSSVDGSFLPHSHVTLADKNFQTHSGHLVLGPWRDCPVTDRRDNLRGRPGLATTVTGASRA